MKPRIHEGAARATARHAVGFVGVFALAATVAFIPIVHTGHNPCAWVGASSKRSLCASNLCVRLRGRCTMPALAETAQLLDKLEGTQLHQLAKVTTLSIDTGDLDIIEQYAKTGLISDATTNPLFVSQAGLSGNPRYVAFVKEAIEYAKSRHSEGSSEEDVVNLAMDRLSVNLGREIATLVSGFVSTEVDIRESFDAEASVARARRIIAMYEELGVPRTRILIKLAATWEGIKARCATWLLGLLLLAGEAHRGPPAHFLGRLHRARPVRLLRGWRPTQKRTPVRNDRRPLYRVHVRAHDSALCRVLWRMPG